MTGALYLGDNLSVLRKHVPDDSVDLIYLDPPFGSSADKAFGITWVSREEYLDWMRPRVLELHRVLKPTGSVYLHCDPTASHYLKIMMDVVFGPQNFRNEIVWKRTSAHNDPGQCGRIHDSILFYTKSDKYTWNKVCVPYEQAYIDTYFKFDDKDGRGRYWTNALSGAGASPNEADKVWRGHSAPQGRHWAVPRTYASRAGLDLPAEWDKALDVLDAHGFISFKGKNPTYKQYLRYMPGVPLQDIWMDTPSLQGLSGKASERQGYPTQKPQALLERIILASSNPGDMILDPFCGCGTTVAAASKIGDRQWIGIDIGERAIDATRKRLLDQGVPDFEVTVTGAPGAVRRVRPCSHPVGPRDERTAS